MHRKTGFFWEKPVFECTEKPDFLEKSGFLNAQKILVTYLLLCQINSFTFEI